MRAIVSYLAAARYMGCHLTVYWSRVTEGPEDKVVTFGDLFELPAAPDLHVLSCGGDSANACLEAEPRLRDMPTVRPETHHIHPQTHAVFPLLGPLALRIFRPLPRIVARIEQLLGSLGPAFVALHIRRTDKNTDYAQDAGLAQWTRTYPVAKVFAAVDNSLSLANLRGALGASRVVAQDNFVVKMKSAARRKSKINERHTTLEDAVVDMWTASFAAHFRGTLRSSYSVLIQLLRTARSPTGEPGIDAWADNCADTDLYERLTPPPPWLADARSWPSSLAFTKVVRAEKVEEDACRKYAKKNIKQPVP